MRVSGLLRIRPPADRDRPCDESRSNTATPRAPRTSASTHTSALNRPGACVISPTHVRNAQRTGYTASWRRIAALAGGAVLQHAGAAGVESHVLPRVPPADRAVAATAAAHRPG